MRPVRGDHGARFTVPFEARMAALLRFWKIPALQLSIPNRPSARGPSSGHVVSYLTIYSNTICCLHEACPILPRRFACLLIATEK